MDPYIAAILLSLGAGALYASLAQGLLLAYRSSGVVNFAHGATALYGAYLFSELRAEGRLVVPPLPNPLILVEIICRPFFTVDLPNWPTFVSLGGPMAVLPALIIAVAMGALIGWLMYYFVFRPMRHSPPLAKVVASVGLMLFLQATVVLRFGTNPRRVERFLPEGTVSPLGHTVPVDRFYLAGAAILIAIVLAGVYRYTRFGWATEAAADNEKGAILTGLSPDTLAAVNWTAAAAIAVFMGVLFATVTALSPGNFIFFVLPALGAMLLGGLRSFVWAAAASFLMAALQGIAGPLATDLSFLPDVGLSEGLPLLLIILAMVLRGKSIPTRDNVVSELLPAAPEPSNGLRTLLLLGVPAFAGAILLPFDYRTALINSAIGVVLAVSLVILVGLVGQISLMQMSIAGLSAVAMTRFAGTWDVPFPVAPLLSALVAAALSLVCALPALRLRGTHLAIVTLAGALAIDAMLLNNSSVLGADNSIVDPPSLLGVEFGVNAPFPLGQDGTPSPGFGLFAVLMAVFACFLLYNIRRGALGRRFLAVRSNERAAAGAGIGVAGTKMLAFGLAGFVAGLAGAIWSYQFESVSPTSFATFMSLTALALVYLAGVTTMGGAITAGVLGVGGLSSHLIFDDLVHAPSYEFLVGGIGLTLAAVAHQQGIAGDVAHIRPALRALLAKRAARSHGEDPSPALREVPDHAAV